MIPDMERWIEDMAFGSLRERDWRRMDTSHTL